MTAVATQVLRCARCSATFERPARRGRTPLYCGDDCKTVAHREQDVERRETMRAKHAEILAILEPMQAHMTAEMVASAEEFIAGLALDDADGAPFVEDRMPAGSAKVGGPDEGCTTTDPALLKLLDERRVAAIMHDWHRDNPQWWREAA